MKAENLKVEHIEKILDLYNSYVGPANVDLIGAGSVLEAIQKGKVYDGSRIGSRWTFHSKLTFRTEWETHDVIPGFNSNFDVQERNTKKYEDAIEAGKLFQEKSLEYLQSVE